MGPRKGFKNMAKWIKKGKTLANYEQACCIYYQDGYMKLDFKNESSPMLIECTFTQYEKIVSQILVGRNIIEVPTND